MTQENRCRLCLNICVEQKQLYDEHRERNLEIFNKMCCFFNPKFLNKHSAICLACWQRIDNFHVFVKNLAKNQYNTNGGNSTNILMPSHDLAFGNHVSQEIEDNHMEAANAEYRQIKNEITTEEYVIRDVEPQKVVIQFRVQRTIDECNETISQWKSNLECGVCQISQSNYSLLTKHFSLEHPNDKTHIFCCKRKLMTRHEIADHASFHIDPEVFKCHECNKCNATRPQLRQHLLRKHSIKLCSEAKNRVAFYDSTKESLQYAAITRMAEDSEAIISQWKSSLECGICQTTHAGFPALNHHFLLEHPQEAQPLILCCKRKVRTRSGIADHARYHLDPQVFKCHTCDKCHVTREQLRLHMVREHSAKAEEHKFVCSICSRTYPCATRLREHMAGHMQTNLYQCPACPQTFRHRATLNRHLKLSHLQLWSKRKTIPNFYETTMVTDDKNADDKPHRNTLNCPLCEDNSRYSSWYTLGSHFKKSHPTAECYTQCCNIAFHQWPAFSEHASKVHNVSLKCSICAKVFAYKYRLKVHMACHAKEQLYKCMECHAKFGYRRSLNVHLKKKHPQLWSKRKSIPDFLKLTNFSKGFETDTDNDDEAASSNEN